MPLTETEILNARIEMFKARIKDLEIENKRYLELLDKAESEIKRMTSRLSDVLDDELDK